MMVLQIIFVLLAGLVLGIALSTGGLLPGGILNSLLILGLNISLKQSINITYVFLTGGGLASALISFPKKNSLGKRLIDYDLMMLTMPMMMSGVIFGAMIKNSLSQLMLVIIFIVLIVYIFITVYSKLRQYQAKQKQKLQLKLNQPLIDKAAQITQVQEKKVDIYIQNPRIKQILQKQDQLLPVDKIKTIGQTYLYTVIILLMKGGNNFQSFIGLQNCSFSTWVIFLLHMVTSFIFCENITEKKKAIDDELQSLGYVFKQNERMTDKKMYQGMLNGFLAGCAAASLSVGAGMVLVPVWFKAGIQRNTAAATSGPLVFMSASISFVISVMLGRYESYMRVFIYFCVGFSWVYAIRKLIIYLIQTYNLKKLTFYLMLGMMVTSFSIIIIMQYHIFKKKPQHFFMFDGIC